MRGLAAQGPLLPALGSQGCWQLRYQPDCGAASLQSHLLLCLTEGGCQWLKMTRHVGWSFPVFQVQQVFPFFAIFCTVETEISVQNFNVQRLSDRPVSELIVTHRVRGSPHCRVTSEPQKLAAVEMLQHEMH